MKSAARLSGSLLVRKGHAAPTEDNSAFSAPQKLMPPTPVPMTPRGPVTSFPASERTPRPRVRPTASKATLSGDPETERARVAMTLRLDHDRHLKLRLMSAHSHLSSQEILTAALDEYLVRHANTADYSHCECLQKGLPPGNGCC